MYLGFDQGSLTARCPFGQALSYELSKLFLFLEFYLKKEENDKNERQNRKSYYFMIKENLPKKNKKFNMKLYKQTKKKKKKEALNSTQHYIMWLVLLLFIIIFISFISLLKQLIELAIGLCQISTHTTQRLYNVHNVGTTS